MVYYNTSHMSTKTRFSDMVVTRHPLEDDTDPTTFDLFLKTHEIRGIAKVLKNVQLMPQKQRLSWLDENGEILQEAFDSFIDESNMVLDGTTLDDESLELTHELVVSLKDAMIIVETIMTESQSLHS